MENRFQFQPGDRQVRSRTAYAALTNLVVNTNVAPAPPVAADVALALPSLTSRTGGRFRVAAFMSGTATAADQITATLEVSINGAGYTAIGTQLLQVSAAAGARFAVEFNMMTAAVPVGQTMDARIRCVDTTGNNITAGASSGQVHINAEEIPA